MSMKLWGVIKGLLVQGETDRTKQVALEVDEAQAAAATKTTIKSKQTVDRDIELPDTDGELVEKDHVQTLTNKTIDATSATGENTLAADAIDIVYDNTSSGLAATQVQEAVDEIEVRVDDLETEAGTHANQSLSNLTSPTAINQDLEFDAERALKTSDQTTNETDSITVKSGDVTSGSGNLSGNTTVVSGDITSGDGTSGDVTIGSGHIYASATGLSGNVTVSGGTSDSGSKAGSVSIFASSNDGSGDGGDVNIDGGSSVGGAGGSVNLFADADKVTLGTQPTGTVDEAVATTKYVSDNSANTALSNLTSPTAVNQSIVPGVDGSLNLGSPSLRYGTGSINTLNSQEVNVTNGGGLVKGSVSIDKSLPSGSIANASVSSSIVGESVGVSTGNDATADANPSGSVLLESGNKTAGTGDSGDVVVQTGTSVGGSRGSIKVKDGSEGTVGHVLTSKGIDGEVEWSSPGGSGGKLVGGGDISWNIAEETIELDQPVGGAEYVTGIVSGIGEGNTFTATSSFTLTDVSFKMRNTLSSTGNVVFNIYAAAAGIPTGGVLATTGNVDVSTLDTSYSFIKRPLVAPVALTSGNVYAITAEYPVALTFGISHDYASLSNPYAGGNAFFDIGTGWFTNGGSLNSDFSFRLYSQGSDDLVLGSDAYIQLPGLADSVNTISAQTIEIPAGEVAYVSTNKVAPGGTLTVNVDVPENASDTDYILASHESDGSCIVGDSTRIKDGEISELYYSDKSSSNGINYVPNPDMEVSLDGYSLYNDGSVAAPVDGTGGISSGNLTMTEDIVTPLRGTRSLRLTKGLANAQGEGVSIDLDKVDSADANSALYVSFDFRTSSSFETGDIVPYIYNIDTSALEPMSRSGDSSRFTGRINTDSTSNDFRLILHVASTSTSIYFFDIDNVKVGPDSIVDSPIMAYMGEYTPTIATTTGTPTNYTTSGSYWRRDDIAIIEGDLTFSGAVGTWGDVYFSLPSGLTVDETKLVALRAGDSQILDTGANQYVGKASYVSGALQITVNAGVATYTTESTLSQAVPHAFASGDIIAFRIELPIEKWANSSAVLSTTEMMNETVKARYTAASTTAVPNSGTVFDFSTKEYDTHNAVSGSGTGWKFTVPKTGYYNIKAGLVVDGNGVNRFDSRIYVDGVPAGKGSFIAIQATSTATSSIEQTFYLQKDQYFAVAHAETGPGASTYSSGGQYVEIMELPDFSVYSVYGVSETVTVQSADHTPTASTIFHQLTGNSFDLTPGTWMLYGQGSFFETGVTGCTRTLFDISGSNGNNTATEPTSLSAVSGLTVLNADQNQPARVNTGASLTANFISLVPVKVRVTETVTLYVNALTSTTTPVNARVNVSVLAERVQ